LLAALLILTPFLVPLLYRALTRPPSVIRLAGGPAGGRYQELSRMLGKELEKRLGLEVKYIPSQGSLQNLALLQDGEVDFALYQQGSAGFPEDSGGAELVLNVYSEPAHILVQADGGLHSLADFRGHRVNLGVRHSGDYVLSQMLLVHCNLSESDLEASYLDYEGVQQAFQNGEMDGAILTLGSHAKLLNALLGQCSVRLLEIPYADSFVQKYPFLRSYQIPAGRFGTIDHPIPAEPVQTVALTAQLLTHERVGATLVEEITEVVAERSFLFRARLGELLALETSLSDSASEFPLHRGVHNVLDPNLKPLLDPDFVEATEGMRSFVVSLLIAGFVLYRWWKEKTRRSQRHQLDHYVHALLEIERRQVHLDQNNDNSDLQALQELLDEVTHLRQEALSEFTVHQLSEDRGVDCFIEMCYFLSDKINAKITRQRLDLAVAKLTK
jgi:hypothetical protein